MSIIVEENLVSFKQLEKKSLCQVFVGTFSVFFMTSCFYCNKYCHWHICPSTDTVSGGQ